MADIERLVGSNEELGRLKLMVVYRNSEKLLTDAIGAAEGIKVVYYQRSMQFKYQGKLRAHDILSAVRYIMSLKHEEALLRFCIHKKMWRLPLNLPINL